MHNEETWFTPERKEKVLYASLIAFSIFVGAGITVLVNTAI
ncbi:hypothetical protein ACFVAD_02870 [Sutcliffiella sp. NPDC057660]